MCRAIQTSTRIAYNVTRSASHQPKGFSIIEQSVRSSCPLPSRCSTVSIQGEASMKILVVYHTVYGHVLTMAKAVQEGAKSVAGSDVVLRRAREFPETVKSFSEGGFTKQ